jgi:hypothetical protein
VRDGDITLKDSAILITYDREDSLKEALSQSMVLEKER